MMNFLLKSFLFMFRYLTLIISSIFLSGCFIFGEPTEFDPTTGQSPDWILEKSKGFSDQRDWRNTILYLEKLIKRYPDYIQIHQARLNLAFAYYKFGQKELCISILDQFITLYPSHPLMDYAYYLKGLSLYQERGILNKLTMQDISDRDIDSLKKAFSAFDFLVKRYPNSKYKQDSIDRLTYLLNKIAEYDLHVARYYMKRSAYIAAVNRAKNIYLNYPDSIHVEESLIIQYLAYHKLGLKDLEENTKKILELNYPDSEIIREYDNSNSKWWEFWRSISD